MIASLFSSNILKCTVLLLFPLSVSGQSQEREVTFLLVDDYGKSLPEGMLSIRESFGKVTLNPIVKGSYSALLPKGTYHITFDSSWATVKPVTISVNDEPLLILLNTQVQLMDAIIEPVSISAKLGTFSRCLPNSVIWAKLDGVFSSSRSFRKLGSSIYLLFDKITPGLYSLEIIENDAIRSSSFITTQGSITTVQVALNDCSPIVSIH